MKPDLVLAITGASGVVYAVRLLDVLLRAGRNVQLTISPAGKTVLETELGLAVDLDRFQSQNLRLGREPEARPCPLQRLWAEAEPRPGGEKNVAARGTVRYFHFQDFMAPMASGSAATAGMVVCPCSGGTLSAIAHGSSTNLIHRAADVHLKEHRKLVLVPRETPLSAIQLENMRRCAEAGAVVLPAMPGFYQGVASIRDLVDFVVARVCDQLEVEHRLMRPWGG